MNELVVESILVTTIHPPAPGANTSASTNNPSTAPGIDAVTNDNPEPPTLLSVPGPVTVGDEHLPVAGSGTLPEALKHLPPFSQSEFVLHNPVAVFTFPTHNPSTHTSSFDAQFTVDEQFPPVGFTHTPALFTQNGTLPVFLGSEYRPSWPIN